MEEGSTLHCSLKHQLSTLCTNCTGAGYINLNMHTKLIDILLDLHRGPLLLTAHAPWMLSKAVPIAYPAPARWMDGQRDAAAGVGQLLMHL